MPNLTAEQDDIEVDSREDAEDLLEEPFDFKREAMKREKKVEETTEELRKRKEELEEEIASIEDDNADYIERREQAVRVRKMAVIEWAQENPDAALDGCDTRTFECVYGAISFESVPFNFRWEDKDEVLKSLKDIGRGDLIRVEEKVPYKSDLKKEPDLVRRLDGVDPQEEHDRVDVELAIG